MTKLASSVTGCGTALRSIAKHSPLTTFPQEITPARLRVHKPGTLFYLAQYRHAGVLPRLLRRQGEWWGEDAYAVSVLFQKVGKYVIHNGVWILPLAPCFVKQLCLSLWVQYDCHCLCISLYQPETRDRFTALC